MTKIIGAPTLDDALAALGREAALHEQRGERTLVFCEDRLTLLAERAVLGGTGGTFLCEVTTFARYLKGAARTLSKYGSVMAISAILTERESELRCFGAGAAQAVYETIAQLLSSRVTAEMLAESAAQAEGILARKLADLSLLLSAYENFLKERGLLDENGYLALLPDRIRENRPQNIIFFGFPSFTRQAREGVRAAIETAERVTGIFLAGKNRIYTNEAAGMFRAIAEQYEKPQISMEPCSLTGEAAVLLGALFSPEGEKRVEAQGVFSFDAAGTREEYETVAALIAREVAGGKRYRDLSVLAGSEGDFPVVEQVFSAHKIPYYLDLRRKFSEHPFCEFLLAVLDAAACGGLTRSVEDVAASVYFGDDGVYRNYLARLGGRYAVKREIRADAEQFEILRAARERILSILALFRAKDTGEGYAAAIRALWELCDGERVTEQLKAECEEERAFLSVDRLFSVLDETVAVAGGGKFTARRFYRLIKSGLEAYEISMLPRHADAVFVGDVAKSRINRAPVLFLTGLTDDVPGAVQDTAVITDGEIKTLSALEVEVEPSIAVVNARAREAFALNVCNFSEKLYLSRPLRKKEGECAPSELFLYVGRAFSVRRIPDLFPYGYGAFGPALTAYFTHADEGERAALREALLRDVFGHGMPVDPEALRAFLQKAPIAEAEKLFFGREISPTLLETYFHCPYQSFAMRGLRLAEREKGPVGAADAGSFVHTVLEQTARRFNEFESEDACAEAARASALQLFEDPRFAPLKDTAAGDFAGGRLVEESVSVARAAYRQLAGSNFRVREAEAELALPDLGIRGRADRIDEADAGVRVIDYKTGEIDASACAYYTGRKLQLELYLLAASGEGRAAGAFYFPAADDLTSADKQQAKFRMTGFYCNDSQTVRDMDPSCPEGQKSDFFEGGSRTARGMDRGEFDDFLAYSRLVAEQAQREMRAGNIRPSPYEGACGYCELKGMCAFGGAERKEYDVGCAKIVDIVRKARGEDKA